MIIDNFWKFSEKNFQNINDNFVKSLKYYIDNINIKYINIIYWIKLRSLYKKIFISHFKDIEYIYIVIIFINR